MATIAELAQAVNNVSDAVSRVEALVELLRNTGGLDEAALSAHVDALNILTARLDALLSNAPPTPLPTPIPDPVPPPPEDGAPVGTVLYISRMVVSQGVATVLVDDPRGLKAGQKVAIMMAPPYATSVVVVVGSVAVAPPTFKYATGLSNMNIEVTGTATVLA